MNLKSLLVLLALLIPSIASAQFNNGQSASAVLGQSLFSDRNFAAFSQGEANNGPNDIGFNVSTNGDIAGVAVDTLRHRLFVSDTENDRVLVYNLEVDNSFSDYRADNVFGQAAFSTHSDSSGTSSSSLSKPSGVAYDSVNDRLFVSDTGKNRVLIFDTASISNSEAAVNVLGQTNFAASVADLDQNSFSEPMALEYDSTTQQLYVADTGNRRVLVFDASAVINGENAINVLGQNNFTASVDTQAANSLSTPGGLAIDPDNQRLFVSDSALGRVMVFDVNSIGNGENALKVFGTSSFSSSDSGLSQGRMDFPTGLAFDKDEERLLVSDSKNARILIFDTVTITNGENALNVLGKNDFGSNAAATTASSLSFPSGMAYDRVNNQLYAFDSGNKRVLLYDDVTATGVSNGQAAVDLLGQTLNNTTIPSFLKGGANNGPNAFGFDSPGGLAVDTAGHRLFVADTLNGRVLVFDLESDNTVSDLTADRVLGKANFNDDIGVISQSNLNRPSSLVYDAGNKRLFVSDRQDNRVLVFDVAIVSSGENAVNVIGQNTFFSGGSGTGQNRLDNPRELAFDEQGQQLFVADVDNSRVLVFNVAAIDNGENAANVLGQSNFSSTNSTVSQNGFSAPAGLVYDKNGQRLFVSDYVARRVLAFDIAEISNGENAVNVLGQSNFTSNSTGLSQSKFAYPEGLTFDDNRNSLIVSDVTNSRVLVFDASSLSDGEDAVNVLGQSNFSSNDISVSSRYFGPRGLYFDSSKGNLWVADYKNNRVLTFSSGLPGTTPTPSPTVFVTPSVTPQPGVPTSTPTAIRTGGSPSVPTRGTRTPTEEEPYALKLSQPKKVRSGAAKLRLKFTSSRQSDSGSNLSISGNVNCFLGSKKAKVSFKASLDNTKDVTLKSAQKGMFCVAKGRVASKQTVSNDLTLK